MVDHGEERRLRRPSTPRFGPTRHAAEGSPKWLGSGPGQDDIHDEARRDAGRPEQEVREWDIDVAAHQNAHNHRDNRRPVVITPPKDAEALAPTNDVVVGDD